MKNPDLDTVAIRESLSWAQWEMARHMGVTQPTIYRWENGGPIPLLARREYERLVVRQAHHEGSSPSVAGHPKENNNRTSPTEPIGETQSAHLQATAPAVNSREVKP